MAELTGAEILVTQATYLTKEITKHEGDIAQAQGKVNECRELLERVENTCLCCGDYIFPDYRKQLPTRMANHMEDKHYDDWEALGKPGKAEMEELEAIDLTTP